jgi:hypothetical protein
MEEGEAQKDKHATHKGEKDQKNLDAKNLPKESEAQSNNGQGMGWITRTLVGQARIVTGSVVISVILTTAWDLYFNAPVVVF